MPYVNIKITKEGATQLLVDVLGKSPTSLVVVIDEVETDNWGIAGKSVTEVTEVAQKLFLTMFKSTPPHF